MTTPLNQRLNGVAGNSPEARAFGYALSALFDRMSSQMYSNAAPVISAASSPSAKTAASITYGVANGVPQVIAAGTALPALTGLNIAAGKFNVFCFFIDQAGNLSVKMGTEGATASAVRFPEFPTGKALVGFLSVTYASPFVGGTTPLDTATTLYFGPVGAFDPTAIL